MEKFREKSGQRIVNSAEEEIFWLSPIQDNLGKPPFAAGHNPLAAAGPCPPCFLREDDYCYQQTIELSGNSSPKLPKKEISHGIRDLLAG